MWRQPLPCCSQLPWSGLGHRRKVHTLQPDRSSSGEERSDHSWDPPRAPCKDRLLSAGGSGTAHGCTRTAWSQLAHTRSLRTYTGNAKSEGVWEPDVHLLLLLTSAVLGQSVAIVTQLTVGTGRAFGVVQAPEALAGSGVTRLWVQAVNVAVALAWQALATGLLRVAIVTRGTLVTAGP